MYYCFNLVNNAISVVFLDPSNGYLKSEILERANFIKKYNQIGLCLSVIIFLVSVFFLSFISLSNVQLTFRCSVQATKTLGLV